MTRIWLFKDKRIRRTREGTTYTKTYLCAQKGNLMLVGDEVCCGPFREHMGPIQRKLLFTLMISPGLVTMEELVSVIYPHPWEEPELPEKCIVAVMYQVRGIIKRMGWAPTSWCGRGWELVKYRPKNSLSAIQSPLKVPKGPYIM